MTEARDAASRLAQESRALSPDFERLFERLAARIRSYGITIEFERMEIETAGKFDGLSITINPDHDLEARCYYLAHSFGSIVEWSLEYQAVSQLFGELRAAKKNRDRQPGRFERALDRFCTFENVASEYAVWLLADIGVPEVIGGYTEFFRADLESMRIYHREGTAPPWPAFFADWKASVARGARKVMPYTPRAVPPFTPVLIQEQEVVQERDGHP
jgi:hypothetical protein